MEFNSVVGIHAVLTGIHTFLLKAPYLLLFGGIFYVLKGKNTKISYIEL